MSSPVQVLDEVLALLQPQLAAQGYLKSARNFVALSPDGVARILQSQSSQLKKPAEACFTINVLVTARSFHEAYSGKPFPKNAASAEPVVQAGLGRLLPDGETLWWSLAPGVSAKLIAQEVGGLLASAALPFLAHFTSEAGLAAQLERGDDLPGFSAMRERCRAVLLAKSGRTDEARKVLSALVDANSGEGLDGFRASIAELSRRLGLARSAAAEPHQAGR